MALGGDVTVPSQGRGHRHRRKMNSAGQQLDTMDTNKCCQKSVRSIREDAQDEGRCAGSARHMEWTAQDSARKVEMAPHGTAWSMDWTAQDTASNMECTAQGSSGHMKWTAQGSASNVLDAQDNAGLAGVTGKHSGVLAQCCDRNREAADLALTSLGMVTGKAAGEDKETAGYICRKGMKSSSVFHRWWAFLFLQLHMLQALAQAPQDLRLWKVALSVCDVELYYLSCRGQPKHINEEKQYAIVAKIY